MILLVEELKTIQITAVKIKMRTNSDPLCSRVRQFMQCGWSDSVQDVLLKSFATRKDESAVQDGCFFGEIGQSFPKQDVVTC